MQPPRSTESPPPPAAPPTPAPLSREEYFAERALLIEARQRGYQRAEQLVIAGAAGALVLSITFLEKLVPANTVIRAGLLFGAWVALLVCLAVSLFSQYASARAFDVQLTRLDAHVHNEPQSLSERWTICNRLCSSAAAVLLIAGIALLAWFAYVNAPFNH